MCDLMKNVLIGSKTATVKVAMRAATAGMTTRGWLTSQSLIQCDFILSSYERRRIVPALPPPASSATFMPWRQFLAIMACLIRAKSRKAYLGSTFESDGCDVISAILPYFRKMLYRVSCDNSAASAPGNGGTNSTLIRQLGNRYKSSSQGFPTTKFVRTLRKGENQGFMGFSLR